jgi:hypothetical protein
LREALIQAGIGDTKRQAVSFIAEAVFPTGILDERVSRLSLKEIESLANWLKTLSD